MTKQEFIHFMENLKTDFIENKEKWENKTIEDYLEAMSRYVEDIDGYYENTNQDIDLEKIDWKVFADLLKGSSIYE
ncbi:hypothetical protein [Chryseobacterium sp. JAH]|uniref:DUF7660 family protein n=1 Tax=Chryseobacterium sp. JAH TaxID=1742858 RepID=UPI00074116C9|nr:hypothetical protein [Chryseobacterium sp. JAH]KUJ50450.1 hypothetical protein AR685_14200 [Chryseobacterium sp. JAH]